MQFLRLRTGLLAVYRRESFERQAMYRWNGRVGIMAEYPKEVTTDIPEHAHLKNDPFTNWDDPLTPWDERTRGLG